KRVSLFSPGQVVLEHVPQWLKIASEEGEFHTRTVFLRKGGTPIAADIRITPTYRDDEQIGFCGVTTPLPDVDPAEVMPEISTGTKMFSGLVITRAPFLTATIIPILIGATWVATRGLASPFPWGMFWLALVGGVALHIAANTFNDYFDWMSGTDKINNDYFLPYSGGSRSIELGLITEKGLFRVGTVALGIALIMGLVVLRVRGPIILFFGLFGAFSAYFYTAPPLRLVARKGLGELLIGLNFGPLMVAGTVFTLTGQLSWMDFFAGIPIGLLTTAILWINQYPDTPSDAAAGKSHLVVVLGRKQARWGYLLLMVGAFGLVIAGMATGVFPLGVLLMLASLPMAVSATRVLFQHYEDRSLIKANVTTIKLQATAGLLLAAGIFWSEPLGRLLGL
ncbi:MAG: UbiA family prenyltransferase, partial [Anaerolineales bacterium]